MVFRMKVVKAVRATEWWEYKLAPLLGLGYATAFAAGIPLIQAVPSFLVSLAGLIVGAAFASLINDVTDVGVDVAVGKMNRMAMFSPAVRWLFVIGCLVLGVLIGFFIYPDLVSLFFYAMAWLSFILYSVPPIRLKTKGGVGVVCCACGESVFPALFIASRLLYSIGFSDHHLWWLLAAGIWAFTFGLRAILWHQFVDRENDIVTNTSTFATRVAPQKFRPIAACIFIVELIAVVGLLLQLDLLITWLALLLYVMLVIIRYKRYANMPIILFTPVNASWQMMMTDFYQAFLPVSLLVMATLSQPWAWLVLLAHILLFPYTIFIAIRDYSMAVFALYKKARLSW